MLRAAPGKCWIQYLALSSYSFHSNTMIVSITETNTYRNALPSRHTHNKTRNIRSFIVDVHYLNSYSLLWSTIIPAKNCEKQLLLSEQYGCVLVIQSQERTICQHLRFLNSFITKPVKPAHPWTIFPPQTCCLCSLSMSINFHSFSNSLFSIFQPPLIYIGGKAEECATGTEHMCAQQ